VLALLSVLQPGSPAETQPQAPRWAAFGYSVALLSDTVFVAARDVASPARHGGTVHVFERRPEGWVRAGILSVPEANVEDPFGVSMSADGDTLVVGAQFADAHGTDAGLAYVFDRVGGKWHPSGVLYASDGAAGDQFGLTVSVSGEIIAIGARLTATQGPSAGAAYLFARNGRRWHEVQKLVASDATAGDLFGRVALDHDVLFVSADLNDDRGTNAGKVYRFQRRSDGWVEENKILASDGAGGDEFGATLAIKDGVSVFGAIGAGTRAERSGAAYAFELRDGTWVQVGKLGASDAHPGQGFGSAVAVGAGTIAVGAPDLGKGSQGSGAAYIFERRGGTWTQAARLTAGDTLLHTGFGSTVGLAGDLVVIGSILEGDQGPLRAVYVFERRNGSWSEVARLTPNHGSP
jgi:hypothetical protein